MLGRSPPVRVWARVWARLIGLGARLLGPRAGVSPPSRGTCPAWSRSSRRASMWCVRSLWTWGLEAAGQPAGLKGWEAAGPHSRAAAYPIGLRAAALPSAYRRKLSPTGGDGTDSSGLSTSKVSPTTFNGAGRLNAVPLDLVEQADARHEAQPAAVEAVGVGLAPVLVRGRGRDRVRGIGLGLGLG